MKVNSNIPHPHINVAGNAAAGRGSGTQGTGKADRTSGVTHNKDTRFAGQLDSVPVVRAEVVAEAAAKVAGGDYLTDGAAEATAEAILNRLG